MSTKKKSNGLLALVLALPFFAAAQKTEPPINLVNPSFEGVPKCCETPTGWYNCGKAEETAPDIQPGTFAVNKAPSDGETYLGMVVRDNDTWEAVGQRLERPLEMNREYDFALDLCRSELYQSMSRTTGQETNYATPATVRIWGGMGYCDKRELLAQTTSISHPRWLTYNFRLAPKKGSYTYILIEAYFKTPQLFPYNGNILMDNASPIRPVPLEKPKPDPAKTAPAIAKAPSKTPAPKSTPAPTPAPNKFDRKNLTKGATIRIENIYFEADKWEIKGESEPALNELYGFLASNTDVSVEIGGHTNNTPPANYCDELSEKRAHAVATWLIEKGIAAERVQFKGYGKRYPVAANTTTDGRRKNQRVEIKILNMNG